MKKVDRKKISREFTLWYATWKKGEEEYARNAWFALSDDERAECIERTPAYLRWAKPSDIMAASGVASSSIYHHFSSKAGVFEAVLQRGAEDFFAAMRAARSEDDSLSPEQRLRDVLLRTARAGVAHARFLRLYQRSVAGMEGDQAVHHAMVRARDLGSATLRANIEEALGAWESQTAHAAAARMTWLAVPMLDGMATSRALGEIPDLEEFATAAAEALYALARSTADEQASGPETPASKRNGP